MSSSFRSRSDSNGDGHQSHDIDKDPYKPSYRYAQLGGHQNRDLYPPSPSSSPALSSSSSFSHHALASRLDHYFHITARGSTITTELRSGVVSFATMAYILIVNAQILSRAHTAADVNDHMPFDAIVTATAITACSWIGVLRSGWQPAIRPGSRYGVTNTFNSRATSSPLVRTATDR